MQIIATSSKGFIVNDTIKKLLLQSTTIAGLMATGFAGTAYAQDSDDSFVEEEDTVVVTGSRIVRQDNYTAIGPVNVIGSEDIEIASKASLGDLLEELPSVSFVGDGTNVNNGSGGLQTIDLRGLGAERLLVLFNGRRVNPVGSGTGNLVDLQVFPQAAVDRIEILKDGAAAVYGADAVSGVLNVITTKDFEGVDLTMRAGSSERGDGEQLVLGGTFGTSTENASLMATLSYSQTEGVLQSDRAISNCPRSDPGQALWVSGFGAPYDTLAADPLNYCLGSSFIPNGRFFTSNGSRTIGPNGDQAFDFFGGDAYNFNPLNYLRTPNTSLSAFITADYDISENIQLFTELLYNKRTSNQDLAPVPLGAGAQQTYGLVIPEENPFNIYGEDITYRKRMLDVGARLFEQDSDTFRTVVGLKGRVGEGEVPFFSGASWEASFTSDLNNGTDKNGNLIDMFRVQNALDVEETANGPVTVGGQSYRCADATARLLGCVPLNLFGANSITTEAAEYIRLNTVDGFGSSGTVYQATMSNSLFSLPAGDVGMAIGFERRTLEGNVSVDAAIANGYSSGNPQQNTDGRLTANDYFAEIEVPLLADMPFAQELTLDGAYRISDYDSFDAGETYRIGLSWSPVQDLRFRGGIATSFRTPSIDQLFGGGAGGFPTYNDPCLRNADIEAATAAGICASQGVAPSLDTAQNNAQVLAFTVGARIVGEELLAERGKTYTIGGVYRPTSGFLSDYNFEAAVDYSDITVRDSIETTGTQATINNCYLGASATACAAIQRSFGGDISLVNTSWTNAGGDAADSIEAIDFSVRGSMEAFRGDIGLDIRGTHTLERGDTNEDGFFGDFTDSCFGFTASCVNEWRVNGSLSYSTDNLRVVWSARWLSSIDKNGLFDPDGDGPESSRGRTRAEVIEYYAGGNDLNDGGYGIDITSVDGIVDAYFIDDFIYNDINMRYSFDNDLQFSAGIDNMFDKQPPLYKYVDATFDPTENTAQGTYDTLGRFFYVGFDKKF